jgi:diacylglycerol kinase family enzyme
VPYECLFTQKEKHASEITGDILKHTSEPTLHISGGEDGTLNEVMNGAAAFSCNGRLVVLPI